MAMSAIAKARTVVATNPRTAAIAVRTMPARGKGTISTMTVPTIEARAGSESGSKTLGAVVQIEDGKIRAHLD